MIASKKHLHEILVTLANLIGLGDTIRTPLDRAIQTGVLQPIHKCTFHDTLRISYEIEYRIGRNACTFRVQFGNVIDKLVSVEVNLSATGALTSTEAVTLFHKMSEVSMLACHVESYLRFQLRNTTDEDFSNDYGEGLKDLQRELATERNLVLGTE